MDDSAFWVTPYLWKMLTKLLSFRMENARFILKCLMSKKMFSFSVKGGGIKLQNHEFLIPYVLIVLLLFLLTIIIEMLCYMLVVASPCEWWLLIVLLWKEMENKIIPVFGHLSALLKSWFNSRILKNSRLIFWANKTVNGCVFDKTVIVKNVYKTFEFSYEKCKVYFEMSHEQENVFLFLCRRFALIILLMWIMVVK